VSELLCVIAGPTVERRRESVGELWCFGCRKRLPHDAVVLDYAEPSYYEPILKRECSRCHRDETSFPEGGW
jgi:hypothetical protein